MCSEAQYSTWRGQTLHLWYLEADGIEAVGVLPGVDGQVVVQGRAGGQHDVGRANNLALFRLDLQVLRVALKTWCIKDSHVTCYTMYSAADSMSAKVWHQS